MALHRKQQGEKRLSLRCCAWQSRLPRARAESHPYRLQASAPARANPGAAGSRIQRFFVARGFAMRARSAHRQQRSATRYITRRKAYDSAFIFSESVVSGQGIDCFIERFSARAKGEEDSITAPRPLTPDSCGSVAGNR